NVLKKPTPLIEIDDQHRARPIWAGGHSVIHRVEEIFAIANVRMRMIVRGNSFGLAHKLRFNKRDMGKSSRGTISKEFIDRPRDTEISGSPKRQEWKIAEVIAVAHAVLGQPIPNRRQLGERKNGVIQPIRLGGVLIDPVRVRPRHNRGEVAITGGPRWGGAAKKGEITLGVVADGIVVVGARAKPAIAPPLVILDAPAR